MTFRALQVLLLSLVLLSTCVLLYKTLRRERR